MSEEERAMMRQLRQMVGKKIADAFKAYYAADKDVSKMNDAKQKSMVERILKGSQKVSDAWKAWRKAGRDLDELTLAQYVIVAPVAEAWDAWRDAGKNVSKMTDAKQIRIVEGSLKGGEKGGEFLAGSSEAYKERGYDALSDAEKHVVQSQHDAFVANVKKLSTDAVSVRVGGEDILIVLMSTNKVLYEWWKDNTGQRNGEAATGWKKKTLEKAGVCFEINKIEEAMRSGLKEKKETKIKARNVDRWDNY